MQQSGRGQRFVSATKEVTRVQAGWAGLHHLFVCVPQALRALAKSKNDVEAHIFGTRDSLEYNEALKQVCTSTLSTLVRFFKSTAAILRSPFDQLAAQNSTQ